VQKTAETDSAPAPSDGNRAKPMLLKKCEIFSSLMSPRAATRHSQDVKVTTMYQRLE
jgi:hypothetical protein